VPTSRILAAALEREGADLVLFGQQSSDSDGAVLWSAVADRLRLPVISQVAELELGDGKVKAKRQTEFGYDVIEASTPAVVAVSDAINEPRFPSLKGIMGAKSKPQETVSTGDLGLSGDGSLEDDFMHPSLQEVVLVPESDLAVALDDPAEPDAFLVLVVHVDVEVIRIRWPVVVAVDDELMQVAVLPTHHGLNDLMEIAQAAIGDQNSTPGRWADVLERDLELIDPVGRRDGRTAGLDWFIFSESVQEVVEIVSHRD
jgi:electron transfer flavoprotein alpha/beta subunit